MYERVEIFIYKINLAYLKTVGFNFNLRKHIGTVWSWRIYVKVNLFHDFREIMGVPRKN